MIEEQSPANGFINKEIIISELPVFDGNQLREMVMDNLPLLERIVAVFMEDTPAQINELERLLADTENLPTHQKTIERLLHSLKGEASNVGAARLSELAFMGEKAARAENFTEIHKLLPMLQAEFKTLQGLWTNTDWSLFLS